MCELLGTHTCSAPLSCQQRLREAVRGWLANNEVRVAKDTLEKARRSIEIQMVGPESLWRGLGCKICRGFALRSSF